MNTQRPILTLSVGPQEQRARWGTSRRSRYAHPNWPASVAAFNANAQARKYGASGRITTADVLELWKRQPTCADCGTGRGLDHVQPIRLGGLNEPSNLRNLCRFCNASRGGINSAVARRQRRGAA